MRPDLHYLSVCTEIGAARRVCNHTDKENASYTTERRATDAQLNLEQYLELLLGQKGAGSAFASDESRRTAWSDHAPKLLALVDPGSRPWAWWEYDAPEPLQPRESELGYLARCGLLSASELAQLARAGVQVKSQATRKP